MLSAVMTFPICLGSTVTNQNNNNGPRMYQSDSYTSETSMCVNTISKIFKTNRIVNHHIYWFTIGL